MNNFLLDKSTYYYYEELSSYEKHFYKTFLHNILSLKNVVEVYTEISAEQIRKISRALINDRPDIFWYKGSYTITTRNNIIVRITFDFTYSENQVVNLINDIVNSSLYREINSQMILAKSEFEKALCLYEFIIKNTEYEQAALSSANNCDYAYGIEGVLLRKRAVCTGYAKTFQYFSNKHNIVCTIVTGQTNRGRHAWNLINLHGGFYYVDATWGDPTFANNSNKAIDYISYDYFCITTDELIRSHRPIFDVRMPLCSDTKYNYYRYFGLVEDSYSVEGIAKHIINAKKQGKKEAVIKYSSEETYMKAVSRLFKNSEVFDALKMAQRYCGNIVTENVRYTINNENRIITIKM